MKHGAESDRPPPELDDIFSYLHLEIIIPALMFSFHVLLRDNKLK